MDVVHTMVRVGIVSSYIILILLKRTSTLFICGLLWRCNIIKHLTLRVEELTYLLATLILLIISEATGSSILIYLVNHILITMSWSVVFKFIIDDYCLLTWTLVSLWFTIRSLLLLLIEYILLLLLLLGVVRDRACIGEDGSWGWWHWDR